MAIGLLGFIFYQDLKYKAVTWLLFPIVAMVFLGYNLYSNNFNYVLLNSSLNVGFIAIQLLLLSLYFSIKSKKIVNIAQQNLGWGDILFLLVVCLLLPPNTFFLYYITSLIIIVLKEIVTRMIFKKYSDKIPLAGLQALLLAVLIIVQQLIFGLNITKELFRFATYG
jgi:hypothetical protein